MDAVLAKGKSLLPSGVQQVNGTFEAGAFVALADGNGTEFARGKCNFSSSELTRIRGMKSAAAAQVLGRARIQEVVHRDNLVLAAELQQEYV